MRLNKILFLVFLVLYFIAGFSLLIIGSVAHRHASHYAAITGRSIMSGAGLIIALGIFIILSSALGYIGAYKNRLGLLQVFICSLVLILLLQLIATIVGFTLRKKAGTELNDQLTKSIVQYQSGNSNVKRQWNDLQQQWSCCGVMNYTDWINPDKQWLPPNSCCSNNNCNTTIIENKPYFSSGCYESAQNLFVRYSKTLGGVTLFFFFVEIIGLILAIFLLRDLKNNYGSV